MATHFLDNGYGKKVYAVDKTQNRQAILHNVYLAAAPGHIFGYFCTEEIQKVRYFILRKLRQRAFTSRDGVPNFTRVWYTGQTYFKPNRLENT